MESNATHFTMPGQGYTVNLPTGRAFYVLATVLVVGTLSCFALILVALIAVSYLLLLAVNAVCELVTHIALVYDQADSLAKIIVWFLVVLILVKLLPVIVRSMRASFALIR